jgi:hypothetical protein
VKVLAGVNVFSDAHQVEPVQLGDRRSPEYGSASDEEGALPALPPTLDRMVEEVLLIRDTRACGQGSLKNILVIEMVRSLDEAYLGIRKNGTVSVRKVVTGI